MACCGKVVCSGCICTPVYDNQGNEIKEKTCPLCRTPVPTSDKESIKRFEKRMELNDADAIYNMGSYYARGLLGLRPNQAKALELYHRAAAELGHPAAFCSSGNSYYNGRGVERDEKKANHYYELAAMRGQIDSRHNLGNNEWRLGNIDRALKHWMISVRDGEYRSLQSIKDMYMDGDATKDDYAKALRSYQKYLDEIKSDQRDKAAAAKDIYKYYETIF